MASVCMLLHTPPPPMLVNPPPPRSPLKQAPSTDHLGPLLVPAGADSFSSIGLPHGQQQPGTAGSSSSSSWDAARVASGQQQWLDAVSRVFPESAGGVKQGKQQPQRGGQAGHVGSAVAFNETYREEGGCCCCVMHTVMIILFPQQKPP